MTQITKNMKYLAINIRDQIHVLNNSDGLESLIENKIPYKIIGRVCTEECNTKCHHYRAGTCPCKTMKDIEGKFIHIFTDN